MFRVEDVWPSAPAAGLNGQPVGDDEAATRQQVQDRQLSEALGP